MMVELRNTVNEKLQALRFGIARGQKVWPEAMASPPNLTAGSANTASTITGNAVSNPTVKANDSRITWLGTNPVQPLGSGVTTERAGAQINNSYTARGSLVQTVEFMFDGTAFDIAWRRYSTPYILWVDGVPTHSTSRNSAGAGGAGYCDKVEFASRGLRRIRIQWAGGAECRIGAGGGTTDTLYGINLQTDGQIFAAPARIPLRGMVISDSWGTTPGVTRVAGSSMYGLGRLLGIDDWWVSSIGGTGIIKTNTSLTPNRVNWASRTADFTDFDPDVIFMPLSINDSGETATIDTAYPAFLSALQAALPHTIFVVIGPPNPSAQAPSDAVEAQMIAAMQSVRDETRTVVVDNYSPAKPFSGTGSTGSTSGTGNQDYLIGGDSGTDKAHLVQAGHDYYAEWLFSKALVGISGLPA